MRGLRIGPHWCQVLSIAGGRTHVVVGAAIVHTDGVDLGLIGPPWLTIGLFMAITGVYAALLTLSGEPLLKGNSWVAHAPTMLTAAPLALWIPLAPLLGILVRLLGVGRRDAPDTTARPRSATQPWPPWPGHRPEAEPWLTFNALGW